MNIAPVIAIDLSTDTYSLNDTGLLRWNGPTLSDEHAA